MESGFNEFLSRERRSGYTCYSTLPRPQEYSAHGPLYGIGSRSIHKFLEGLTQLAF